MAPSTRVVPVGGPGEAVAVYQVIPVVVPGGVRDMMIDEVPATAVTLVGASGAAWRRPVRSRRPPRRRCGRNPVQT